MIGSPKGESNTGLRHEGTEDAPKKSKTCLNSLTISSDLRTNQSLFVPRRLTNVGRILAKMQVPGAPPLW
jgi:hypothetical protein